MEPTPYSYVIKRARCSSFISTGKYHILFQNQTMREGILNTQLRCRQLFWGERTSDFNFLHIGRNRIEGLGRIDHITCRSDRLLVVFCVKCNSFGCGASGAF